MSQTLPPGFGDWTGDAKYELRGTLGAGAMGVVLDGFDRVIERRVAIKVVRKPAADDAEAVEAAARFRREAQAAGRLSHPGIVGIYDYGEDANTAWIVMEMVQGGTLKAVLDRGERLPVRETARLMGQVLNALAYAHARGVVHRDIKPANVMLTADGDAKLADFGIARLENSAMTQVGTLMGTPSYMAPEQLRGEPLDARADIWAAGVMLYQLLTGEKPFPGGLSAVMHKALNTEPVPPSALSATTPPALDAVVMRALAKRPDDRWPDARAFAQAIDAAISAPATSPAEDTTLVARPAASVTPVRTAEAPRPARPAWLLPAAGAGLIAAGAAAFLLWPGSAPPPTPATDAPVLTAQAPQLAAPPATPAAPPAPVPAEAPSSAPPPAAPPRVEAAQPAPSLQQSPPSVQASPVAPAAPVQATPAAPPRTETAQANSSPQPQPPAQPAPAAASPAPPAATAIPVPPATVPSAPIKEAPPQPPPPAVAQPAAPTSVTTTQPAVRPSAPVVSQPATPTVAAPAAPTQPAGPQLALAPVPRPDLRAAASAALSAAPCGLLSSRVTESSLEIQGVLPQAEETRLRGRLAESALPAGAARLQLGLFDGPFCTLFPELRPALAEPDAAPLLAVDGTMPLRKGQLLRLSVQLPPWANNLHVAYATSDGQVVRLEPGAAQTPGARVRLGDPRPGFPGWEIDEPFGTDLLLAVVSEGALFPPDAPIMLSQAAYAEGFAAALRSARVSGRRVALRPLVVDTVAK